MKSKLKVFGQSMKMVGYSLPKTIVRRTFTNANITDHFPKKSVARRAVRRTK